jgi:hypothetical protein
MNTLTYQTAEQIALHYGMNWNKDPQWHQEWFDSFAGFLYACFQNYDQDLVHRAAMQYITDSTDKRLPPFGDLKAFMVKKLGAAQVRQALQASSCQLCENGTRRLYVIMRIDEDRILKREWVARCTCSRGALNTKADNYEQFINRLRSSKGYVCLGYRSDDPHSIEILEWYVTTYSKHSGRDEYPAGVNPSEFAGMTKDQIGAVMAERRMKMKLAGIAAQKKQFRAAILKNKNSPYLK